MVWQIEVPMLKALTIDKPVKKDKMKSFGEVKETGIIIEDSVFADILRRYHSNSMF